MINGMDSTQAQDEVGARIGLQKRHDVDVVGFLNVADSLGVLTKSLVVGPESGPGQTSSI